MTNEGDTGYVRTRGAKKSFLSWKFQGRGGGRVPLAGWS